MLASSAGGPGSIPSQGPRHTKDVIKMVPNYMSHSHIPLYNIFSIVIEENQDLEIMISYGKHLDMFSHDLLSANVYVNSSGIDDISTMIMSLGKMY